MKRLGLLSAAILYGATLAAGAATASPEFLAYEGRNAIHEGQGGEKKTVEGIDFWFNGDPPRRYQVIGAINDRRMRSGIYGAIRMSGLETDIAKTAKSAGGDAVIQTDAGDDVIGVSGASSSFVSGGRFSAGGFGTAFAAPVKAHVTRYIVVRYLPDAETSGAGTPSVSSAGTAGNPPPNAPGGPSIGAGATGTNQPN